MAVEPCGKIGTFMVKMNIKREYEENDKGAQTEEAIEATKKKVKKYEIKSPIKYQKLVIVT